MNKEVKLKGIAASPGISHGFALIMSEGHFEIPCYSLKKDQVANEIDRFNVAINTTKNEILKIRKKVSESLGEGEALIFDAHLMVLEDSALITEIIQYLNKNLKNIEFCFNTIVDKYISFFKSVEDDYLRERVADIKDVSRRVLQNLLGKKSLYKNKQKENKVIVSEDISPSLAVGLNKENLLGFITNSGGATSHFVIMSRSFKIPAVVGLHDATSKIKQNDYILIDGYEGLVYINPTQNTLDSYKTRASKKLELELKYKEELYENSVTIDGEKIKLMANIESSSDVESYLESNADGIGLFRTEGIYLRHNGNPSEEDHYREYLSVVKNSNLKNIIIRTLDIGGDKTLRNNEDESFLGLRAIRFCLENLEVFKIQLRALLRVSIYGDVRIMYPMISGIEELDRANLVLNEVKEDLERERISFNKNIQIGAMIELPSAVTVIDLLAEKVDFFSIGTNDLIQYLMAVDRMNDRVSHLYQPAHPAVLRSLKAIFDSARNNNKPVSVCGEMAGEPIYAALLIGLGAKNLSISISRIPEVKHYIRKINFSNISSIVDEALTYNKSEPIEDLLNNYIKKLN